MSNLYVKTVTDLFGDEWIATLTPYEKCSVTEDRHHYILEVNPETHIGPDKWEFADEVPIDKLQLCILLDGDLYVWAEWKGL